MLTQPASTLSGQTGSPARLTSVGWHQLIDAFPKAHTLLGDKGYDADWFRHALIARGITPCIPAKSNRKVPIPHDYIASGSRSKTCSENSRTGDVFTRATIAVAHTFMSAICIAATAIFWL